MAEGKLSLHDKVLGAGSYALVFEATLRRGSVAEPVAARFVKATPENYTELMGNLLMMKNFASCKAFATARALYDTVPENIVTELMDAKQVLVKLAEIKLLFAVSSIAGPINPDAPILPVLRDQLLATAKEIKKETPRLDIERTLNVAAVTNGQVMSLVEKLFKQYEYVQKYSKIIDDILKEPNQYMVFLYSLALHGDLSNELKNIRGDDQKKSYAQQLICIVKTLVDNAMLHGDLKPENILVYDTRGGVAGTGARTVQTATVPPALELKLADLDSIRFVGPQRYISVPPGTIYYQPPELFSQAESARGSRIPIVSAKLAHAIDIYALGIMLLEIALATPIEKLLTNPRFPDDAKTIPSYFADIDQSGQGGILARISDLDTRFPSRTKYTNELLQIVRAFIQTDPAGRIGSFRRYTSSPYYYKVECKSCTPRTIKSAATPLTDEQLGLIDEDFNLVMPRLAAATSPTLFSSASAKEDEKLWQELALDILLDLVDQDPEHEISRDVILAAAALAYFMLWPKSQVPASMFCSSEKAWLQCRPDDYWNILKEYSLNVPWPTKYEKKGAEEEAEAEKAAEAAEAAELPQRPPSPKPQAQPLPSPKRMPSPIQRPLLERCLSAED